MKMSKTRVQDVHDATHDAKAQRRTLARLRLCRMKMRRQGKLFTQGYRPPHGHDVERIWKAHGWRPSRWAWSHAEMGYRPVSEGGIERPSQRGPLEIVPMIDSQRRKP